jgi:hypothetical protein
MFMFVAVVASFFVGAAFGQPALQKVKDLAAKCPVLNKDVAKKD